MAHFSHACGLAFSVTKMALSNSIALLPDLVGAQLKIVTNDDETILGEFFAFDSGFVALVQEPSCADGEGRYTFKIINTALVKHVSLVKRPSESKLCESIGDIRVNLTPEYLERAKDIERKAVNLAVREANQINPEASLIGQQLFNAISKTYAHFFIFFIPDFFLRDEIWVQENLFSLYF